MQFMEMEPLLAEAAEAIAATGARMGIPQTMARAATVLENLGPAGVSAGVAAGAYFAKRPFGMLTDSAYKAGKRMKRVLDDGWKPKKLIGDIERSLLPAQTSKMPRRAAKATKSRVKRVKGKPVKKKRTSSKKKAKATRKTKKSTGIAKNVVHKQQPHGVAERDDILYMGFQHHGGRDEILEVVVDSLLRKYLAKFHITIDSPDVAVNVQVGTPMITQAQMIYQSQDYKLGTAGAYVPGVILNLDTTVYQLAVQQIALEIKTQAETGHLPVAMFFLNHAGEIIMKDRRLADAIVNPTVSATLRIRNITPNDSGDPTSTAGDRFALDTNPLIGKMYQFKGDIPIVKNVLLNPESNSLVGTSADIVAGYAKWMDAYRSKGVCGTNIDSAWDPQLKTDQILSTPPVGSRVFNNCTKTVNIGLSPGGAASHVMRFSFKGTFNRFIRTVIGNGATDYNRFGACTWFGFEQKFSNKGAIGAPHDKVRVEYDAHYTMRCGSKLLPPERTPATVDTGTINF